MKTLACLRPGAIGQVDRIDHTPGMTRRLMDLGFTKGARVRSLFPSPGGRMIAYGVRGTVIALRKKDAQSVLLREDEHEKDHA